MPNSTFTSDILNRMSCHVQKGEIAEAERLCDNYLAVELGTREAARKHLETMKRANEFDTRS